MTSMTTDRRTLLKGAIALSALATPVAALAASKEVALKTAITANHAAAVKRLQEWIALPSIAAEDLNYPVGAEYMAKLATDAGFQHAEIVPTGGKPGVFATLDAGAKKTLGLYFMYDVKQFDPKEWSSPPLEGRLIDRPGLGKVMIGRGAVN
jgi:acetylornithine deacetylase/succinyl-diaminopimelate desuccinylase-like protein